MRSYEYTLKVIDDLIKSKRDSNILFIGLNDDAEYIISEIEKSTSLRKYIKNSAKKNIVLISCLYSKCSLKIKPSSDLLASPSFLKTFQYDLNDVDMVVAIRVFEHMSISDIETGLWQLYKLLKPSGKVIITVPDLSCILQSVSCKSGIKYCYQVVSEIFAHDTCNLDDNIGSSLDIHRTVLPTNLWESLFEINDCFMVNTTRTETCVEIDSRKFYTTFELVPKETTKQS